MGRDTAIEWARHTFNPWRGCTKVDEGCRHCYAEVNYSVKMHGVEWGPTGTRVKLADAGWKQPLAWDRAAAEAGERHRVFCASLADVFEDWTGPILTHRRNRLIQNASGFRMEVTADWEPLYGERLVTMQDLRDDLFRMIDATPNLDWLLLTKRPENIRRFWRPRPITATMFPGMPGPLGQPSEAMTLRRPNVWLGCSVSDQTTLAKAFALSECYTLAPVLWLSAEPLLGPIDWRGWISTVDTASQPPDWDGVDWVVIGGESGPHARPCNVQWIALAVEHFEGLAAPLFVKQLGSNVINPDGHRIKLQHDKGGDWSEWPARLRVRQLPTTPFTKATP